MTVRPFEIIGEPQERNHYRGVDRLLSPGGGDLTVQPPHERTDRQIIGQIRRRIHRIRTGHARPQPDPTRPARTARREEIFHAQVAVYQRRPMKRGGEAIRRRGVSWIAHCFPVMTNSVKNFSNCSGL